MWAYQAGPIGELKMHTRLLIEKRINRALVVLGGLIATMIRDYQEINTGRGKEGR